MMMIHYVAVYNLIMDYDTKDDNDDFVDLPRFIYQSKGEEED